MPCYGYTKCELCQMPVCPDNTRGKPHRKDYKWLEKGKIFQKGIEPVIAHPSLDSLQSVLSDKDKNSICCYRGNFVIHEFCLNLLNNTPLPTNIYNLLANVRLDFSPVYPWWDGQTSYRNNLYPQFEPWMSIDPRKNTNNMIRIKKIIKLFVKKWNHLSKFKKMD